MIVAVVGEEESTKCADVLNGTPPGPVVPHSPFGCRCNRQKSVSAEMGSSSAIPGQTEGERESDALPQFFGKQSRRKDGKEEGISKSN